MAKSTAPSPKANLLRSTYLKLYPAFNRMVGEIGRVRGTPTTAAREVEKAQAQIAKIMADLLGRGAPVVSVDAAATAKGEHWLVSGIVSPRNALYARGPLTVSAAFIEKNGTCSVGAVYIPQEELCIVAEVGLGVSGEGIGRLRVGNRAEVKDALAMLPWKTPDVIAMKLMEKLDKVEIHTRKSGNTLADVVDVAMGRADIAIATRVNKLEALLGNLIMAECGGFASDKAGKALGPDSDTMLAGNIKMHTAVLKLL